MNKAEVMELFQRIKYRYAMFQVPNELQKLKEMASDWHESLKDVPYEITKENLLRHAATEKYPPTISDLCRVPERDQSTLYHEHMKASTQEHLNALNEFEKTAVGPTPGQRERVREILERGTNRNTTTTKY
ncbi:replicative helicase loader/inhibitor [Paenibacillus anseongense]|uniref:replicative helicase loader/inhibitor n=1 Tax=Paenibacillus anseongense TaxID=2682845 RepID=UPI002DB69DE8|nr:replicative helicase loader/inhibitor [Paenibacillus anseongense]MEC0269081.1 replicative helicase loader/inhibitor [Paenibacillus anseongense]